MGSIKAKMGYCPDCGNTEPKPLISGCCSYHYWQKRKKPLERKPVKIKPVSDKKAKELAKYRVLRDEYMKSKECCEYPDCNQKPTDLHHKKTRKYHLCDVSIFMALCRKHHNFIHENDALSREMGFLIDAI